MPLQSSENRLAPPTSPANPADGPVLECAPPGADPCRQFLRIHARRVYPISREDLFAIWTRRQGWDAWMRLRARSRSSLAGYRGGAFRLELAEGPAIHVVTGVVVDIQPNELISLEWVHDHAHDRGSRLDVTFRPHGAHAELALTHREISHRREASWLMRLWTSALVRLDAVTADGRLRSTRRVRDIAARIPLSSEPEVRGVTARTFAQSAALVFALAALPFTGGSAQPAAESARAAAYFTSGKWTEAAQAYGALTRTDTSAMTWYRYGVALDESGRHEDAVVALRRALRTGTPFANQVHYRLARAHVRHGAPDSALAELDRAANGGYRLWETVRDDSLFALVRGDPRFTRTLARLERNRFPCRQQPEHRQLDFWVGDWRVVNGATLLGTNRVELVNGDCAVQENWTSAGSGGGGKSWSYYDASIRKWRQVFIFDTGDVWDYTGELRDRAMQFDRSVAATPNTPAATQRMTFFPIAKDSVRQLIQSSTDGGKTWTVDFDGMYVRATPTPR
jgi:uncharacterized protein YndB with AHSA1/START domain